jgi:NitT/TauT family transport system permease protein
VFSGLTLIAIWDAAAAVLPSSIIPGPLPVWNVLWDEAWQGSIWTDVAVSMTRIAIAFLIAMSVSLFIGFAMGLWRFAEAFFEVWIICCISLPSLVTILTIYMIVGLNDSAAVLAAAVPVIPILTINIWGGIKAVDHKLIDMARAYHSDRWRTIRSVVAPQVAPTIVASARFGLGLIWKMVLFVELLGRNNGIGYKIEYYYQMFNMKEVLAHALLFLFIMLFIETAVIGTLERRLFHWRPAQRQV